MSIETVAEYVETEEIRALVATLGVDYGQGFAIGKPRPLAEVLAELPRLVTEQLGQCVGSESPPEQGSETTVSAGQVSDSASENLAKLGIQSGPATS
jgi:predicted signal transduction protein with EAL and GGDEF domain